MNKKMSTIFNYLNFEIEKYKLFSNLTENEEVLLTRELINFIIYCNNKINSIEEYLETQKIKLYTNNEMNYSVITELWLQEIAKPTELEDILENIDIIADVYSFVEKSFKTISFIYKEQDFAIIHKKNYRTKEQSIVLQQLITKNDFKSKKLKEILKKNKYDVNHISKTFANTLISNFQ